MATAYLLASVLTLIVVLVHGQEAFPEQGNIVVVAEDSFEDELNSFTDLILPGSANTRAECIQKKKCKNKGGTCQNKGNTCPGKFVKGCSKGCSCCLPEEISCKPSKRCKRANGACIARGECNGKIISTGCKKPRSCKKTHVCCVQDETTTEVPTCRGPSCPLPGIVCPNEAFTARHVCSDCKEPKKAVRFVTALNIDPGIVEDYLVFYAFDNDNDPIDYTFHINCFIKIPVKTFSCSRAAGSLIWTCPLEGYCTCQSTVHDGDIIQGSQRCPCPNPVFEKKHLCDDCTSGSQALTYTINNRKTGLGPNTVFDDNPKIGYELGDYNHETTCKATRRANAWDVYKNDDEWGPWVDVGSCGNIQSILQNGHFIYDLRNCYKMHDSKIWSEGQCASLGVILTTTHDECMKRCDESRREIPTSPTFGCTAFDYKIDQSCTMRKCPLPVPIPDTPDSLYNGYYLYTGYKIYDGRIWSEGQCASLGDILTTTHEECLKRCDESRREIPISPTYGCTAFDYKIDQSCTMRKCLLPVPMPDTPNSLYNGYYLYTDST